MPHTTKKTRTLRLSSFAVLAAVGATWLVSACGSDKKGAAQLAKLTEPCSLNSDCNSPLVCAFQRCHAACNATRDCPNPARCVKGTDTMNVCQFPTERSCHEDSECSGKEKCAEDKECRDPCQAASECTKGQVCSSSGACAEPSECLMTPVAADPGSCTLPVRSEPVTGGGGSSSGGDSGVGGNHSGGGSKSASGGTAGVASSADNAGAAGSSGSKCPTGLGDCDNNPGDCETDLTLPTSCGACDVTCSSAHASVACDPVQLKCVFANSGAGGPCDANYADCDGQASNGCETELLSAPENCGSCGRSCGGSTCSNGLCDIQVVVHPPGDRSAAARVSALSAPNYILYVWQFLYSPQQAEIRSVKLPFDASQTAGTLVQAFSSGAPQPGGIAVDADNVYFATDTAPYTVFKKPLDGSGVASAVFDVTVGPAQTLFLTATAFYFNVAGTFYTIAKDTAGSSPATIPGLSNRGRIGDLRLIGGQLFWLEANATNVQMFRAPLAGGTPALIDAAANSAAQSNYSTLTSDGAYVYWNAYETGQIRRVPIAGTAAQVTNVVSTNAPMWPLVDATYLYFQNNGGAPKRVKKDGSDPFTVEAAVDDFRPGEGGQLLLADGFIYNSWNGDNNTQPGLLVRSRVH